ILVTSITLILYLPVGLRVLVNQSSQQLTARAVATPLVVGAKGSPLELVLDTLYFGLDVPEATHYAEMTKIADTGLATAIPVYTRFRARGRGVRRFRLLLAEGMFDPDAPVEVSFRGRTVRRRVRPSRRVLLEHFAERFDRTFLPLGEVTAP
ncbi:MAG: hypothetical protein ACE5JG_11940, partial [Planctomycetota bacterium]